MNKRWLVGCGIAGVVGIGLCVGLGALLVGSVFALTRPSVEAAERFLALLGEGKATEAYASAADGLRAEQDEASFVGAVRKVGLTDYSSVSWHSRQVGNGEGSVEGTVTTKNGDTRPVSIRLVQQGQQWSVVDVRYGGIDLAAIKSVPAVPPDAEAERMSTEALLSFNRAVRQRDFTSFYGELADVWKQRTTPQQLRQAFQEFLEKQIDIGGIRDVRPRFGSPPKVNDRGVLVFAGKYPTQPSQVRFELQYARENSAWKLAGISVGVEKQKVTE
jgi:hypothetical protein